MSIKFIFNLALTFISTNLVILLGGWDKSLQTLCLFIAIDYITGVFVGYKNKELSSRVGFRGISKKICLLAVVMIATMIDTNYGDGVGVVRLATIFFYMSNEGISILENLDKLEVKYPDKIKQILKAIKKK